MTDNEIIKALECCVNEDTCDNCPIKSKEKGSGCVYPPSEFYRKIRDLINRQKEEKEALIAGQETLQKYIAEQKAEIERLKEDSKRLKKVQMQLDDAMKMYNVIKAEAYKEFADKVHAEIHKALESNYKARAERIEKHKVGTTDEFISYCQGKIDALRGIDDFIDDTYKEMVGEGE